MTYRDYYLKYCKQLNNCTSKNEVRQHNAAMKKLGIAFRQLKTESEKSFLLDLLHNEDERTRLLVAAHCLGLNVYTSEATKVLEKLSKADNGSIVSFEAQATLDVWKEQGFLDF